MHQPVEYRPPILDVDGVKLEDGLVTLWGKATEHPNGRYRSFANVFGMGLCIVELSVSFPEGVEVEIMR